MTMKSRDFLLKIVEAKAQELGRPVALHVRTQGTDKGAVQAAAIPDAGRWETPMVALLSQKELKLKEGDEFYLSYPPTEACHGFRLIRTLTRRETKIIYRNGNDAVRMFRQVHSPGQTGYVDEDLPEDHELHITQPTRTQSLDDWLKTLGGPRGQINRISSFNPYKGLAKTMYTTAVQKFGSPVSMSPTPVTNFFAHLPNGTSTASAGFANLAFIKLAYALVRSRWRNNQSLPGGNNVAAVLVDATNALVGWSVNCKDENVCFHAETALVLRYLNVNGVQQLPAGYKLYTTLEPCHMCAGLIAHYGQGTQVFFGQKDPGVTNNALARQAGGNGSRQQYCVNRRSEALSRAYTATNQNGVIGFLNSDSAKKLYDDLRKDLIQMNRGLNQLSKPRLVTTRATSESVFGRLNLDVPNDYVRQRQGPPLYGAIQVRGADVTEETALLNRCADLLKNLAGGGLITRPAELIDL